MRRHRLYFRCIIVYIFDVYVNSSINKVSFTSARCGNLQINEIAARFEPAWWWYDNVVADGELMRLRKKCWMRPYACWSLEPHQKNGPQRPVLLALIVDCSPVYIDGRLVTAAGKDWMQAGTAGHDITRYDCLMFSADTSLPLASCY